MDTKILLENGTNELEVLEFLLDGNAYGINVAKVKEIISYQPVTPVPNAHPSIEGIFMPRETMITAIDLKNCLQRGVSEEKGLFIITNFVCILFTVKLTNCLIRTKCTGITKWTDFLFSRKNFIAKLFHIFSCFFL